MSARDEILIKSEDLFLRYGIKSVSMDDIARQLGMSKKTLYQYFENKAALVESIGLMFLENERQLLQEVQTSATDAIHEMMLVGRHVLSHLRRLSPTTMYDLRKYYRDVWAQFETYNRENIYRCIRDNIERGKREGLYHKDANADIIAKLYVGKSMMIIDEEVFPMEKYPREKLFKQYIIYHIRGVALPRGLQLLQQHLDRS